MRIRTIFIVLLLGLIVASCGTTKEMRRSNRAARLVEKAKRIDPSIVRMDTVMFPVVLKTPVVEGHLEVELPSRPDPLIFINKINETPERIPEIVRELVEMPCIVAPVYLENDTLLLQVSVMDGRLVVNYRVKSYAVAGDAEVGVERILPTKYNFKPKWWHTFLIVSGGVLWLIILLVGVLFLKRLMQ